MCLNCVLGPLGSELKPLMFTILRFLRWRLFSQKFYQKLRLNVIFFGWCFWFVWLVCWSVCCVTGDVGDEFIWHSSVAEWRDEILFVSSLCAVFSVWEWQVQQSVCQLLFVLVRGDLKEKMFFAVRTSGSFDSFCRLCGGLLHEVSWRCDVFLLVQRGQGSTNQISDCCWSSFSSEGISLNSFLGHILVCFFVCLELCFELVETSTMGSSKTFCRRAEWPNHIWLISLRRHLSVRVLSATERLPVVVRACAIKCCDGGAVSWILWEWACPPSGTVFHVMLGHNRKHMFLRQWCEGE